MNIENKRFDQIMAILLANMVNDFKVLANTHRSPNERDRDVSDYGGHTACLLTGASVDWNELQGFVAEFSVRFKLGDFSPMTMKMLEDANLDITNVVEDIRERAVKYGFTPTDDTARELVNESASLLGINLPDSSVKLAVEKLMTA